MEVKLIRKGSKGLVGTFENANHHAKKTIPIIKALVSVVESLKDDKLIRSWQQGHNIHKLELKDGRQLSFRPFQSAPLIEADGIQVNIFLSRKNEARICVLRSKKDVTAFSKFLKEYAKFEVNFYGMNKKG